MSERQGIPIWQDPPLGHPCGAMCPIQFSPLSGAVEERILAKHLLDAIGPAYWDGMWLAVLANGRENRIKVFARQLVERTAQSIGLRADIGSECAGP